MDYCAGGDMYTQLSSMGKFTESQARYYAAEIFAALQEFHRVGILYRDLKIENILLDSCGHIKLADLGLCAQNVTEWASGAKGMAGTPEYLG